MATFNGTSGSHALTGSNILCFSAALARNLYKITDFGALGKGGPGSCA